MLQPLPERLRDALRASWEEGWRDGQEALAAEIFGGDGISVALWVGITDRPIRRGGPLRR